MARIEAGISGNHETILEIPVCRKGGDHSSILKRAVNSILENELAISSYTQCNKCDLEIVVRRNPETKVISASLEKPLTGSWLGM